MLESLYLSAGLGTSWCLPGGVGGSCRVEEYLDCLAQTVAPATLNHESDYKNICGVLHVQLKEQICGMFEFLDPHILTVWGYRPTQVVSTRQPQKPLCHFLFDDLGMKVNNQCV